MTLVALEFTLIRNYLKISLLHWNEKQKVSSNTEHVTQNIPLTITTIALCAIMCLRYHKWRPCQDDVMSKVNDSVKVSTEIFSCHTAHHWLSFRMLIYTINGFKYIVFAVEVQRNLMSTTQVACLFSQTTHFPENQIQID